MIAMGMVSMGISGQGCVCQTRSLVHRSIYDEFLESAPSMAGMVKFGSPFDAEPRPRGRSSTSASSTA